VPVGLGSGVIQLTAQMRILVAVASIDFRAGIDGLVRVCRAQLDVDPFCGWLVVFCNRRRTAIKILTYDGQGFWVCHKMCRPSVNRPTIPQQKHRTASP
jgi:transposase